MTVQYLNQTLRILLLFILTFVVLYFGAVVLIPLTFGLVLALLLLPVCHWLQARGLGNGWASGMSVLALIAVVSGIITLLQYQLTDLLDDLSKIEQRVNELIEATKNYVQQHFGISHKEQQKIIKEQQSGGVGQVAGMVTTLLGSFAGILVDTVLVLVYTFLFIFYRSHFKKFVLRLFKADDRPTTEKVLNNSGKVIQSYLGGLALMIVTLWVMYGIGFSIVGVKKLFHTLLPTASGSWFHLVHLDHAVEQWHPIIFNIYKLSTGLFERNWLASISQTKPFLW